VFRLFDLSQRARPRSEPESRPPLPIILKPEPGAEAAELLPTQLRTMTSRPPPKIPQLFDSTELLDGYVEVGPLDRRAWSPPKGSTARTGNGSSLHARPVPRMIVLRNLGA